MDIERQKRIVGRFLRQCNAYADGKLTDYTARLAAAAAADTAEIERKIAQWKSYQAFNEHALDELATDRLDHWFDETG